jgi:multidrug resistance efflux pump
VSQQELDDAVQSNLANLASIAAAKGKYDHSKAAVTAAEAQIGVARSSLQAAELNLDFTKVKSPVTGLREFAPQTSATSSEPTNEHS